MKGCRQYGDMRHVALHVVSTGLAVAILSSSSSNKMAALKKAPQSMLMPLNIVDG